MRTVLIRSKPRRRYWKRPRKWVTKKGMLIYLVRLDRTVTVWYGARSGFHASAVSTSGVYSESAWLHPVEDSPVKRKMLKQTTDGANAAAHLAPLESTVMGKLFNIVSHCCLTRYDDGEARTPGWITVKTQGAAWIVQVKDPDGACSMQCLGNTLDDALALADLLLGSEDAPWEPDRWLAGQKTNQKKRA